MFCWLKFCRILKCISYFSNIFFQINIYMTHLSNYGNDRLALYTFESVIKFVQCWTNLQLKQGSPMDHAIRYFDLFPEEEMPIWRVRKLFPFCFTGINVTFRLYVKSNNSDFIPCHRVMGRILMCTITCSYLWQLLESRKTAYT